MKSLRLELWKMVPERLKVHLIKLLILFQNLLIQLTDDRRDLRWVYQMGPMMVFARETLMSFLTLMDVLRASPRVSVKVELMVFLKLLF